MDMRKAFDMSPWDSSGSAFNGLTRSQSKYLALFFIVLGISLADPPFSALPTDFINLYIAGKVSQWLSISFALATLLSYTVIAWAIIGIGIWIYPYDSSRLLNGYINKAKRFIQRQLKSPASIALGIILFYVMYNVYQGWLF
jgi:hypothetical protein